jgi:pyruvate,water dikinase
MRPELVQRCSRSSRADVNDVHALQRASTQLQQLVNSTPMPASIASAVLDAYRALGDDVRVAVRSSATMEDTAGTSFAG